VQNPITDYFYNPEERETLCEDHFQKAIFQLIAIENCQMIKKSISWNRISSTRWANFILLKLDLKP